MKRRIVTVTRRRLTDPDERVASHAALTPAERLALVWELTRTALCLKGGGAAEPRLQRSVVRLRRLRG